MFFNLIPRPLSKNSSLNSDVSMTDNRGGYSLSSCVLNSMVWVHTCIRLFVIPWTVALQVPLSMELSQQQYWSGLLIYSRGSSWHMDQTPVPCISCIGRQILFLPLCHLEGGEGNGNPLQYSCLENPMERGTRWLQSMRSQSVRHDWVTEHVGSLHILNIRIR